MKYFLICAWIIAAAWADACADAIRIRLLAEVTVQAETLRLSDLLPAEAAAQLKAAAEKVSLGHAPQAGSLRVLTVSELRQAVGEITSDGMVIDIPEQVLVRRQGWPLETEAVRRTLARSKLSPQFDLSQARITLPTGFTTVVPDPQLEVTVLNPSPDHGCLLAQMRCRKRSACGSFLIEIVFSVPAGGIWSRELKLASEKAGQADMATSVGPILVKPGRMALLVIDGDGLRITQPVLPLKQGRFGERVKVSNPQSHRSWLARVSGEGMLHISDTTGKEEGR